MTQYEYALVTIRKFLVDKQKIIDDFEVEYFHYSMIFESGDVHFNAQTRNGLKRDDFEAGTIRAFFSGYEKHYELEKTRHGKDLTFIDLLNYLGSHGWELTAVVESEKSKKEYYLKRVV